MISQLKLRPAKPAPVIGSMNGIYRSVLTSHVLLANALVEETILALMSSVFIPWELFMILALESLDIVSPDWFEIRHFVPHLTLELRSFFPIAEN